MTSDPRLDALDDLLLNLPDDEGMLLSEFDGFCAGLIVCPEMIKPSEWLPAVWGPSGAPDFGTDMDLQHALDLIMGHYNDVVRSLMPPEIDYGPVFDQDMRSGEILWETWVSGFEHAMRLRADAWERIVESPDEDASAAVAMMLALSNIARGESDLPANSVKELTEQAPDLIPDLVIVLNRWTKGQSRPKAFPSLVAANAPTAPFRGTKAGRNDPCPCGSGRKHKRCCGAN